MRKVCFLLLLINLLSTVWAKDGLWFGTVFASVMSRFTIDSNTVQNAQCRLDNDVFVTNLANGTYWAVQMDDASAKSIGGLFEGDTFHPGHPSQCVHTEVTPLNISGKYCLVTGEIRPNYATDPDFYAGDFDRDYPPYNTMLGYWEGLRYRVDILWHSRNYFKWGLCIPSSCAPEDVLATLKKTLVPACAANNITMDLWINEDDCYTAAEIRNRPISVGAKVWIAGLLFLLGMLTVGTTYDWFLQNDEISDKKRMPKLESIVLPFSMITNLKRLCAEPAEDNNKLSLMFGMKALSMVILMFGHKGMARFGSRMSNMLVIETVMRNVWSFLILNGTIVVDTFFMVSGYLTAQQLQEHLKKKGRVNILLVYVDRVMRVFPTYLAVVTFYMFVLPLLGEGPRWKEIMCLLQSWYLTADFQMFLFSIPVLYFIIQNPPWRVPVLGGVLAVSVALPSLIIYQNEIWALFPMITDWFYDPPSVPYYVNFYIQSYTRCIPYVVGITASFVSNHLVEIKYKFSRFQKIFVFVSGYIAIMGTFLYVSLRFYANPYQFNVTDHVFFAPIHRLIWSYCLINLVVVHYVNGFGVISDMLSVRLFIPLSRLCLSTFLVHIGIIFYTISTDEQNYFGTIHKFFITFAGDYLFSILTALLLTLLVEMPFENFWKRLKRRVTEGPVRNTIPVTTSSSTNTSITHVPGVDLEDKKVIGDSLQYTMRL
ncbi:hypothetical protein M8J75_013478 [Diaphorina citri]|nr:hypothetical protein M8J75_013478 [Diaphorina citri]